MWLDLAGFPPDMKYEDMVEAAQQQSLSGAFALALHIFWVRSFNYVGQKDCIS